MVNGDEKKTVELKIYIFLQDVTVEGTGCFCHSHDNQPHQVRWERRRRGEGRSLCVTVRTLPLTWVLLYHRSCWRQESVGRASLTSEAGEVILKRVLRKKYLLTGS